MILLTDTYDCLGKAILSRLQANDRWGGIKVIVPPEEDENAAAAGWTACRSSRMSDYPFPDGVLNDIDTVIICTSNLLYDQRGFFRTLIRAAKGHAVKHLLFVSSVLAGESSATVPRECRETETDIHDSGIPYTILRINILMEHLGFFIGNPCENRTIYYPAGDGKINFISSSDVAEVIYHILMDGARAENRIYTLSHPEGYSFRDIASQLSQLKHIDVSYENVDVGLYRDALFQTLLPTDTILRLCNMAECVQQNRYNIPDCTLQRMLSVPSSKRRKNWFSRKETGRPAKKLFDYLSETAWNNIRDFS